MDLVNKQPKCLQARLAAHALRNFDRSRARATSKWTDVGAHWRPCPAPPPPPPENLDSMVDLYLEALRRMPIAEMPHLARYVCFGSLTVGLAADPVANIVLSALVVAVHGPHSVPGVLLSTIAKETFLDIARRSHAAAVVFLQCYFRYITKCQAARYLRVAGHDLALAVQLVERHRGGNAMALDPDVGRTKTALALAVREAKYPVPDHLVSFMAWAVPIPLLNPIFDDLRQGNQLTDCRVLEIMYLLRHLQPNTATIPRDLAAGDPDMGTISALITNVDPSISISMMAAATKATAETEADEGLHAKVGQLDAAHLVYIRALSLLPADVLRKRGLIHAVLATGHCYGPFHDPAVNIIFSSIWHYHHTVLGLGYAETSLAAHHDHDDDILLVSKYDDILDTRSMTPIESCYAQDSVDHGGLIKYPHPLCDAAITRFFRNLDPDTTRTLCTILTGNGSFSSPATRPITSASLHEVLSLLPRDAFRNEPIVKELETRRPDFTIQQRFIRRELEELLQDYGRSQGPGSGLSYKLGVICGVATTSYSCVRKCYHVNFLASLYDDEPAKLFFAEFCYPHCLGHRGGSAKTPLCYPIDQYHEKDYGRCFFCEASESRILHPSSGEYYMGEDIGLSLEDLCDTAKHGASTVCNGAFREQ